MNPGQAANALLGLLPVVAFLAALVQFDVFKLVRLHFILKLVAAGAAGALTAYGLGAVAMGRLNIDYIDYMRLPGPVIEETLKAAIALFLIRTNRIGFALDAIIAGFAIGAGFALLENYYYLHVIDNPQPAIWVVRGFGTAIMHGGATAIFAVLTQIVTPQQKASRLVHAIPGLIVAMLVHLAYNQFFLDPVTSALVVMVGLTAALGFGLRRGQRSLDAFLQTDFEHYENLLNEIRSGDFGNGRISEILRSFHLRLDPSETAEIVRYVELHAELVLFGKASLEAEARGETAEGATGLREKFAQFNYLEERVGRAVRMLLKHQIRFSRADFFQLYKIGREAGSPAALSYAYNSDLLLSDADRQAAQREFPDVFFALDHAALRERFSAFDQTANNAKKASRKWGLGALGLALCALLTASAEPLYADFPERYLKAISAAASLMMAASVVFASFGLALHQRKRRWLADRLATERLRTFHFQRYVANARAIVAGATDPAQRDAYLSARDLDFATFETNVLDRIEERLHKLVHEDEEFGDDGAFDLRKRDAPEEGAAATGYFEAYGRLRFDIQLSYCNHVLRRSRSFWRPSAIRQIRLLTHLALYALLGIFVFQQLVLIGVYADVDWMKHPVFHVLTIWAAFVALAAKTYQEGFQPKREVERIRQYRLSLRRANRRFREATSNDQKIDAMLELENLANEEVILFIKSNYEADVLM